MKPDREQLILAERVRMVDTGSGDVIIPALFACTVLGVAASLWPFGRHALLVAWVVVTVSVQMGQLALAKARDRADLSQPGAARYWANVKTLKSAAHGLCWGSLLVLFYDPAQPGTLTLTTIYIVAMTASTTAPSSPYVPSLVSFVTCGLAPPVLHLLWIGGRVEAYVAVALTVLWGLLIAGGVVGSAMVRRGIILRLDMGDRVEYERQLLAQTVEARRLAEASSAERSRFFGAASHDLRQPVHALGLYASLLRRDPPPAERRELIAHVGACIDSLDRLFNAILGITQAERAQLSSTMGPVALQDVIERVLVQFRPEAQRLGLVLRSPRTRAWVRGDAAVLERVLGNLVSNAIRYTPAGKVLVGVRRREGAVLLAVADTGIGMQPQELGRIFDEFYQVGNPQRDRAHGFGLGLATVQRLCAASGYPIAVRSVPGRGSVFTVSLPACTPGAAAEAVQQDPHAMEGELNVLFVEDDPLVRDAMSRMLRDWNLQVHLCARGQEALEVLAAACGSGPPGRWHVLLDYRLADGENGLAIADLIRARFEPAPAISLLTGEADEEVFEAARERGITVLPKPLKPIRLRAILQSPAPSIASVAAPGQARLPA